MEQIGYLPFSYMKTLIIIFLFLSFAGICIAQKPAVGAIRWDAWYGNLPPYAWNVGVQVEHDLGPNQYHYRVPFFGQEAGTDSVSINGNSQAIMDQEITYAKNAGINYWAFVYYPDSSGMDYGRNLYNSSTIKANVNACYILDGNFVFDTQHINWLVARFQESNYQKVVSGRPLVYIFTTSYTLANINSLRKAATTKGIPTPYIVAMSGSASSASSLANAIGADAISSYFSGATNNGGVYSPFVPNNDQTGWNSYKSTGKKVIPWVTTGRNAKPRIDNPVSWTTVCDTCWVQDGTPAQIAQNLSAALIWVQQNATTDNANAILLYAWNEHDEGGWICPTITVGNNSVPNTVILDSIAKVLLGPTPLPPPVNLALNQTYSSSSQWDASQAAAMAFDGNFNTDWQAQSGSKFSSQWLQVSFSNNTTFNNVILSEYGNRTTGFTIQYSSNGKSWSTAYTGTTIGTSKTISFPAVTGKYARIAFTSGSFTPIIYEFQIYYSTQLISAATGGMPQISSFIQTEEKEFMHIYPNPAFENATISYAINAESKVGLTVYNYLGQRVKTIQFNLQSKGLHQYNLNLTGLGAGFYLVKLYANGHTKAVNLVIIK